MLFLLYLFSWILFLGFIGILINRRSFLTIVICLELSLLAINCCFLVISVYVDDLFGQIFTIFILTVAAAESSIGLAVLLTNYNLKGTAAFEFSNLLKG